MSPRSLLLCSGLKIDLNNYCYSSEMARNIVYFHCLYKQGFTFSFDNQIGAIMFVIMVFFFILEHCLVMVYMKLRWL